MGKIKLSIGGFIASVTALVLLSSPVFAATATVVVKGNTSAGENQSGWLFNRDTSTSTPYEFNTDQNSIGQGSLYVKPITNTLGTPGAKDKFIAENFINTQITNVNDISYDFRIGGGGTNASANQFYMNVYANFGVSNDLKFYDCRYNVVPTIGSTGNFTTVTFDPTQAYPVTKSGTSPFPTCPAIPADMNLSSAGSNIRMFSLNVGDTDSLDAGLDGYLDNVVTNLVSGSTIYDFEPTISLNNKDQCKNGGWVTSNTPVYKNQGDCVSAFASNGKAKGNPANILNLSSLSF